MIGCTWYAFIVLHSNLFLSHVESQLWWFMMYWIVILSKAFLISWQVNIGKKTPRQKKNLNKCWKIFHLISYIQNIIFPIRMYIHECNYAKNKRKLEYNNDFCGLLKIQYVLKVITGINSRLFFLLTIYIISTSRLELVRLDKKNTSR